MTDQNTPAATPVETEYTAANVAGLPITTLARPINMTYSPNVRAPMPEPAQAVVPQSGDYAIAETTCPQAEPGAISQLQFSANTQQLFIGNANYQQIEPGIYEFSFEARNGTATWTAIITAPGELTMTLKNPPALDDGCRVVLNYAN